MTSLKLYTLKEVAELLHVTERTLLSYIKSGKLPAKKIGGKWQVTESELNTFIAPDNDAGRQAAAPELVQTDTPEEAGTKEKN